MHPFYNTVAQCVQPSQNTRNGMLPSKRNSPTHPLYSQHFGHSFDSLFVLATMQQCMHNLLVQLASILHPSGPTQCYSLRLIHQVMRFVCSAICLPAFQAYLSHALLLLLSFKLLLILCASQPYCQCCIFALLIGTYALAFCFLFLSSLSLTPLPHRIAIKMQ